MPLQSIIQVAAVAVAADDDHETMIFQINLLTSFRFIVTTTVAHLLLFVLNFNSISIQIPIGMAIGRFISICGTHTQMHLPFRCFMNKLEYIECLSGGIAHSRLI